MTTRLRVQGGVPDISRPGGASLQPEAAPGGAERSGETLGALAPEGVRGHALSCTCLGLLHPASQPALQSGWLCLLRSCVPSGQVVLILCEAQKRGTGQLPSSPQSREHCSEGPGPAPGWLPTVSRRLRHSTDLWLAGKGEER